MVFWHCYVYQPKRCPWHFCSKKPFNLICPRGKDIGVHAINCWLSSSINKSTTGTPSLYIRAQVWGSLYMKQHAVLNLMCFDLILGTLVPTTMNFSACKTNSLCSMSCNFSSKIILELSKSSYLLSFSPHCVQHPGLFSSIWYVHSGRAGPKQSSGFL